MRQSRAEFCWVVVACCCLIPAAAEDRDADVAIQVRTIGAIPAGAVTVAERTAGLLFRRIGVEVRFVDEASAASREIIHLGIWETAPLAVRPNVLGMARTGPAAVADVFYDRVSF